MHRTRRWTFRRALASGLTVALTLLFAPVAHAEPPKGKQRPAPHRKSADATLEVMTTRSSAGLSEVQHPNGMASVDLEGRYQHVLVAVPGPDGKMTTVCTDDLAKANAAAGR